MQPHLDRYNKTPNWSYTQLDQQAEPLLSKIQSQARLTLPQSIYSPYIMTHYDEISQHQLYSLMKSIPKGVLHHCHLDCCEDKEFYRRYIINDPIIYLNQQLNQFRMGTKKQAQQQKWISFIQLKQKLNFTTQQQLINYLSNITMFNKQDNYKIAAKQVQFWPFFQKKIVNFFTILFSLKHFKLYMKHICQKFIQNGYDRVQFRSMISQLTQYDQQGNIVKKHQDRKYLQVLDQVHEQIRMSYNNFSFGIVFFGLKMFTSEMNQQIFTKICQLNWNKTLGFDLVQEEDAYGSLQDYDKVVNKVLAKYPHLNYKKVYHAGQTKSPVNNNIQIAVKAGSVRIGHGINIIQHMQILPLCLNVCFEINHVSNILTSLRDDTRISSAPILLSLGYPITINCDDPGKFGYEDTTMDYFSAFLSFNWSLKDLKLLAIHSINHSICSQEEKVKLLESFNNRWNQWVNDLINKRSTNNNQYK